MNRSFVNGVVVMVPAKLQNGAEETDVETRADVLAAVVPGKLDRTVVVRPEHFDAALFDLDGVVTQTAKIHARAWKNTFDSYLLERSPKRAERIRPFDEIKDYALYVDGKPRIDGVRSFLESRNIILPAGTSSDSAETETLQGLAKRKNSQFHELLCMSGVDVYPTSVDLLKALKAATIKVAVVSSSRNCATILELAGLAGLFDVRVDGTDLKECWLPGKPAPDIFLETARRLDVEPERSIVIEDALAGVDAAVSGGFGLVIGVARTGGGASFRSHGADYVVADLADVRVEPTMDARATWEAESVSPNDLVASVTREARGRRLALFLDYDGTLTPIVDRPENARLGSGMRRVLTALSRQHCVAIISGRGRRDLEQLVGVRGGYYAGSHGFDISGPDKTCIRHEEGGAYLPIIKQAEAELRGRLQGIAGAIVENKIYAVAVHFRLVGAADMPEIKKAVMHVLHSHPELERMVGKKVFELRPRIAWDKGKAVRWLLKALNLGENTVLPVYIGDDTTDEDAFDAISEIGIGILVADAPRSTRARYRLKNSGAVGAFLEKLNHVS
jgi:alpha,alpha-trehalase